MKVLTLISFSILLFGCGIGKGTTNPNMNKLSVDIEVIVNNMPTTDSGSKNYAIITFEAGGDTLIENWKLADFKLMDQDKSELFFAEKEEIKDEFGGKGRIQRKINVRNLPKNLPNTVIAAVTFISEGNNEFYYESDLLTPMIVE